MTPMPNTGRTSPHARCAGCPSCRMSLNARRAGCLLCRTSPIARRAECPSCRTSPIARRAECPSACAESRAARVPVNARRAGRVPCRHESRSMPVVPPSPVPERVPVDARHLPCPGPTYACSRRRQPRFTNIFSFTLPWRCITARSAARLRRGVGPLSRHSSCRTVDRTSLPAPTTARLCQPLYLMVQYAR